MFVLLEPVSVALRQTGHGNVVLKRELAEYAEMTIQKLTGSLCS